ncbi:MULTISPECIES: aminopeptidase N [unclassified Achromobacter]|uniref:aminopeptidase N n=1 Tax=unclassified Achromobacter TaxID=2626865 RepID=UPI000B51AC8C|nr:MULTISPECIES: aminopeptidase N [unclassified Achromobacter]OWT67907.1 aminopeptidase N [Achromobacter sp. HZ34]OWT68019.1 aminopeptidase N [Achromobacter sp. HZ28]
MRTDTSVTIFRKDYQPYPFDIAEVELAFDLEPEVTTVTSRLTLNRRVPGDTAPLVLDGSELELVSVHVDGTAWDASRYALTAHTLTLSGLPDAAVLEIVSRCRPQANSTLMGLYVSGGNFFTQCEAEGFRRITWFADRPDVMSRYRVTLRAQPDYPHLLSNGNLVASRTLPDGRQEVEWEDPFPKPCYLFALVAGQLSCREMRTKTASGREVLLQVYSDPGSEDRTAWALESLERALRWDETRFGLELDLDRFMVVAVRDFNMGAMENKGLNIFNAAYVLANPDTATDANYEGIESVIGHEYFHNWTGNRVTCRDWFQLSLKEGLTVFRDQEFSADMMAHGMDAAAAASARAVKRIDDVATLRAAQFPEDAGPMAHPIRPESYQEIGNFYTATVYEKGAEVIRMQHTLLGEEGFRAGMDEYFRRHDGQAVTCDDFVAAMESVYTRQHPGRDLSVFRRWYRQAGTPRVTVTLAYDAAAQRCSVTLAQRCAPVGVEKSAGSSGNSVAAKPPVHIPFAMGLLDRAGKPLPLSLDGAAAADTVLLELTTDRKEWVFDNVAREPVPSLLRGFSAPVIVEYAWSDDELALLSAHDPDAFARWEAGQELATRQILALAARTQEGAALSLQPAFVDAWRTLLTDPRLDAAYRARALALPSEKTLAERMAQIDPPALAVARDFVRAELGRQLAQAWGEAYENNQTPGAYSPAPLPAGRRALKNLALAHLMAAGDPRARGWAQAQYEQASNMTDRLGALGALVNHGQADDATRALGEFYEQWQQDPLVIDKWFALQATARSTSVDTVRGLMAHPAFTLRNPNRARALVFQFCLNNARGLHLPDGSGYDFWVEQVLALDALNPEIAARLARGLDNWARYTPALRAPMQRALEAVRAHPGLSRNVNEIVSKALELAA